MKKLLPILGFTFLMAACNTTPELKNDAVQPAQQVLSQPDTIGMAAFNAWKAQNELASTNAYQAQQTQALPEKTRTIVKYVPVEKPAKATPATSSNTQTTSSSSTSTEQSSGNSAEAGTGAGNGTAETPTVEKKEGWSKAAKGAVIGGVVGAAGGYGIGRTMDKKDGRIDYSTIMN